jgi:mono/diheme cytochrome c family protein
MGDPTVIVRAAVAVTAALTVPQAFLPPPLATAPIDRPPSYIELRNLTPLALAGKQLYDQECAECHGSDGSGTLKGPSLKHRAYRSKNLSRKDFHRAVVEGAPANRWTFGDMPGSPHLSFNEVELIARYVREVQNPDKFQLR